MDSHIRVGFLAVQFERLAAGPETRQLSLHTPVGKFTLVHRGDAIICDCRLLKDTPEQVQALARRGAIGHTFTISRAIPPKDFAGWFECLLVDDLHAGANCTIQSFFRDALAA